jgi:hypothetical protein
MYHHSSIPFHRLIYSRAWRLRGVSAPVGLFCLFYDHNIVLSGISPMCMDVPRLGICGNILQRFIMWLFSLFDFFALTGLDYGLCFFCFRVSALRGHDTWDFLSDMGYVILGVSNF